MSGKLDFTEADKLAAELKAAAEAVEAERQRQQAQQRQVLAGTLRDGMAKDQHAAQQAGKLTQDQAVARFLSQQRSERIQQETLAKARQNSPEPAREGNRWLTDDQRLQQDERAAAARHANPRTPERGNNQVAEQGQGYRAYAAKVEPSALETSSQQRQREAQEADAARLTALEAKQRQTATAYGSAIAAEVERSQRAERSATRTAHYERERQAKLETATREAAAIEITAPQSRFAKLPQQATAAAPATTEQRRQAEASRLAMVLTGAAVADRDRHAAQLRERAARQQGEHALSSSRFAALHTGEMTDRAQARAARDDSRSLTTEDTEKKKQRINSGDGKTTKADNGLGD